jgi:Lrp/AsnC family transcriptional regulator, leucine-responsive regulatory protein
MAELTHNMTSLDRIDLRILEALQNDGRITNLDLAARVGLSSAPCLRRVRALEDAGVLKQYVALLDPRKVGLNLEIVIDVRLKQQTRQLMASFERRIARLPEVVECCLTAGEWDYTLRVVTRSLEDYQSFQLDKLMTSDSEIAALRSTIIMRKVKSTTRLPVELP